MIPITQLPLAAASRTERFDLKQQMLYETMREDFDAGDQPFPNEIIYSILNFLPFKQLVVASEVCKLWHQLASRDIIWKSYCLKELFPKVPVIDRDVWDAYVNLEQHGLDFEQKGDPCVANKRHYFELRQMASEVEQKQGISILTMPKGLSLNKIVAFAQAPKTGNPTVVHVLWQRIIKEQGDIELKETVTVAITNGVFKDSRNKNIAEQTKLVEDLKCEMPQVVAIVALAILRFIRSDKDKIVRLFGDDPWTITRCMEIVEQWHLVFGGFAPSGPVLRFDSFAYMEEGVGGMREFQIDANSSAK